MVDTAIAQGATRVGPVKSFPAPYYPPTLIVDAPQDSAIVQQEVFGPVLVATQFETDEEAWRLANDTRYGLASYVWTRDLGRSAVAGARLDSGTVWVNSGPARSPHAIGGGWKASGTGGNFGEQAVAAYTRLKRVSVNVTP